MENRQRTVAQQTLPIAPFRSEHWGGLCDALAEVLDSLEEEQFLILQGKHVDRYVQFCRMGPRYLRAEVSSNFVLPPEARLDRVATVILRKLGWSPPTRHLDADADSDPDGSPNHYKEVRREELRDFCASLVDVFVEVLGIHHPGGLFYRAFDNQTGELEFPSLGLDVEPDHESPEPHADPDFDQESPESLRRKLSMTLRALTDSPDLTIDQDEGIQLGRNGRDVYVEAREGPLRVRVWSALFEGLVVSGELLAALQTVNSQIPYGRVFALRDVMIVAHDVYGGQYNEDAVLDAIQFVTWLASRLEDDLAELCVPESSRFPGYL